MTPESVHEIMRHVLWMVCLLAGPILLGGMVIGVIMGILQSATQIQEASLNFIPKLLVVGVALMVGGPWAIDKMVTFTDTMLQELAVMAPRGRG